MEAEQPKLEEVPVELWQLVFQRVPLFDLVTAGRRVCHYWDRIISDENVCVCSVCVCVDEFMNMLNVAVNTM